MPRFIIALLVCFSLSLVLDASPCVKVIDLSWSNPTLSFLEEHLADMEKESPLDGLTISFIGKKEPVDGKMRGPAHFNVWNRRPWKYELLQDEIQRYKSLKFTRFTDNFFYLTTIDVDFDWTSDDDWKTVAGNFGIAARVAREMGLKGLLVDLEEYVKPFWNYGDDVHPKDIAYDDLSKIVYQRGCQWGEAVFGAYPNIVLLLPFAFTYPANLVSPFLNGVLEAMPPDARLYEGFEIDGYKAKTPGDYVRIQHRLRQVIKQKVQKKNRRKARAQLLLAPAFFLDAIFPFDRAYGWHQALLPELDELGPVKFMARNFVGAMEEAAPYIWFYGERRAWWQGSPHPSVTGIWDEAPGGAGISQAIAAVKELTDLDKILGDNLLADPHFRGLDNAWTIWRPENSDGQCPLGSQLVIADGKAVARMVSKGCFHQTVPVKPGHSYFLVVKGGYGEGAGQATATLRFLGKDNQKLSPSSSLELDLPRTDSQSVCHGLATAPADAVSVTVQCGVSGQGPQGEIYFMEIFLFEM